LLLGVEIAGHRSRCWLLARRAWQNTGRTATVGPACCKAARTVPNQSGLVLLGNSGSQTGARCHRGQPQQSKLKIYAGGQSAGLGSAAGMAAPPQDWPADAARL